MLEELGLASALPIYVRGFSSRSGIAVDLDIQPELGRLHEDIEIACFRIIQEYLTNIHRHSKSPAAALRLNVAENQVILAVSDVGQGMSPVHLNRGIGLAGMRKRIGLLGSTLKIESGSSGTTVTAILPLQHPAGAAS